MQQRANSAIPRERYEILSRESQGLSLSRLVVTQIKHTAQFLGSGRAAFFRKANNNRALHRPQSTNAQRPDTSVAINKQKRRL